MAQPLENRITTALRDSSRLKDVETTIADVECEISTTQKRCEQETARSIDPSLTTPQAREARNNAADLEHDIRRLNASLDLLKVRRQTILDDDAYAKRRARYDAAKKARDDLARYIRTRYPVLAVELLEMARRIAASDAENDVVNRDLPRGSERLLSAEGIARGNHGYSWHNGAEYTRIGRFRLDRLGTVGAILPLPERMELGGQGRIDALPKLIEDELAFGATPIEGIAPDPADVAEAA